MFFDIHTHAFHPKIAHKADVVDFNPTAENLARHICESIENCYKVSFQETEGNVACYVKDGEPDVDF